jgi:predicted CXXCH cytochrome family protein
VTRLAIAALAIAACGGTSTTATAPGEGGPRLASNVLRADYAGSPACADCHGAIYAAWQASPMRNMTRDARTATIRAPFDGAQLHTGTDTATMESQGGARFIRIDTAQGPSRWRVTKVIGGRYREDFVGVDVTAAADPLTATGTEHVLPATFVFSNQGWRYKGYSVMVKERPRMGFNGVWSQECIACHNTMPLATLLYDDLYGPSLPAYQGKLQDRVMPASRAWTTTPRDSDGLATAIRDEIRFLGAAPPRDGADLREVLPAAARATEERLDGGKLVELGVGCEACHNGSKLHAATPAIKPTFAVASSLLQMAPPSGETGTRVQWINHTCAKCHTVLFSRYPWTWEDGTRRGTDPGGSSTTSGEGRDFQLGHCASQLACTQCHDPHTMDSRDKLAAEGTTAGDHLCTTCHANVPEHSHHKTVGCIGCHMPKKNMGLDYVMDRYHRIGSPDEPARVEGDRPLECALCHADKSIEQLVSTMESWWGKTYSRDKLAYLYGKDLTANALRATITWGKPHEQAAAMSALGDAKAVDAVAAIAPQLAHDYPLVRFFAQRALQTITGDPVAIDVGAPAADVKRAAQAWLAAWQAAHP